MPSTPLGVLFLCTGNSARSILAEALASKLGGERFQGLSAGSHPKGQVHPLAIETLERHGLPTASLRSKSWDEFAGPDAPPVQIVITVCDQAAAEECPIWPGHPATAHWGLPDPAAVQGSEADRRLAFEETYRALEARIGRLASLPVERMDPVALQRALAEIGRTTFDGR